MGRKFKNVFFKIKLKTVPELYREKFKDLFLEH